MRSKRFGIAIAVTAVAIVAFVVVRRRAQHGENLSEQHAEGVDFRMTPVLAMLQAPEGATPCETAYNGFRAYDEAAKEKGVASRWNAPLPAKEAFLARCNALPANEQQCLVPRYGTKHASECDPFFQKFEKRNPLFEDIPSGGP